MLSKMHWATKQPGGKTWAVQPDSKAVTVLVGHGAGVKTVRVWKPVGLGSSIVLGILGQWVAAERRVVVVDHFPRPRRKASAVRVATGIGSEIERWRMLGILLNGERWGMWSYSWLYESRIGNGWSGKIHPRVYGVGAWRNSNGNANWDQAKNENTWVNDWDGNYSQIKISHLMLKSKANRVLIVSMVP